MTTSTDRTESNRDLSLAQSSLGNQLSSIEPTRHHRGDGRPNPCRALFWHLRNHAKVRRRRLCPHAPCSAGRRRAGTRIPTMTSQIALSLHGIRLPHGIFRSRNRIGRTDFPASLSQSPYLIATSRNSALHLSNAFALPGATPVSATFLQILA